ncbi:MAG: ATP-binding protein [Clostridiales bacterium]|nr:ATP-binding protein [Clostridiales bacterium]
MDRKYLKDLIAWMNSEDRKPLLITGARQVGKTYLVKDLFAETYYKNRYLRLDCSNETEFVDFVYNNDNLQNVLDYIDLKYNFKLDKDHLLIIDEAQECLPIIKMMKHFCELRRDIPLIVTGSMVRIKLQRTARKRGGFAEGKSFLFPVGKIDELYVFPLTFDEFLYNVNRHYYDLIKKKYESKEQVENFEQTEFMDIFYDYLFVGGMPEAVDAFIKNKDSKSTAYRKAIDKIRELYDTYLNDMEMYQASQESIIRSKAIYNNIYKQLAKENKNFVGSFIQSDLKTRQLLSPIEWLVTAGIVNKSYLVKERVTSPLVYDQESFFRLYLFDMGLFTYQSGLNAATFITGKDNVMSGVYYENYVATELAARRLKLFYWKGKRDCEMEFLLDINSRIIPLDSKKKKGELTSLKEFRNHNKLDVAIKVSANNYGYDSVNKILTLPFYYLPFFLNDIQDYKFDY